MYVTCLLTFFFCACSADKDQQPIGSDPAALKLTEQELTELELTQEDQVERQIIENQTLNRENVSALNTSETGAKKAAEFIINSSRTANVSEGKLRTKAEALVQAPVQLNDTPTVKNTDHSLKVKKELSDVEKLYRNASALEAATHTSSPPNKHRSSESIQATQEFGSEKFKNKKPQIAIILDDLGYNLEKAKHFIHLNQPITLSLIPNTPHAKSIAKTIEKEGYELMLHIPMETVGPRTWEQGLTDAMERDQFDQILQDMINDYPTAKGINNHGGSLLTQKRDKMDWIMETLANEQLYFVDSRTIASSVATDAANEAGLDKLTRDVFLDNERTYESINHEVEKLQRIALRRGSAIGIAHPYSETLAVLKDMMPQMVSNGFEFVFISEIASIHTSTNK